MPDRFAATVTGRSLGDHLCWPFHGVDDLVASVRAYVSDGVARHERVTFCTLGWAGMRYAVVSGPDDVGVADGSGRPVRPPLTTEPGWTPSDSPLGAFGRMTRAAVADGYAGLRVLTDATELARHPVTRQQWARSEHLIDRYGLDHPLAVVCGYDVDELGEDTVTELACLHSLTGGRASPFLLRATGADGRLALTGEVDRASAAVLHGAVVAVAAGSAGPLVVDLSDEVFLDHTALVALDRAARASGTTVTLVGASPLTALLVDAFGLTDVIVEGGP